MVERCLWGSGARSPGSGDRSPNVRTFTLAEVTAAAMSVELPLETLEAIVRTNALRYFAPPALSRAPQALSDEIASAER